jgi:hypothetical protein
VELDCNVLGGANFVEPNCIFLGGKLCGTGLYNFWGWGNFVELDCMRLGKQMRLNWSLYVGGWGKLCGTGVYRCGEGQIVWICTL